MAGRPDDYPKLQPIRARPINWDLIRQQYDEMIKYATALRLGTADSEVILKRFMRSNRKHPTYQALIELGKAIRTTFLCRYLNSEILRQEVNAGLNVVENWNSANEFIFYGKSGEIATNRLDDQEIAILSLHLLQACLVYINTLMIQQVLGEPHWLERMSAEDRRALTPIHNYHDFGVGRRLHNLPALRAIGFVAHRRLLEVETLSRDCTLAEELFDQLTRPQGVAEQRGAALRFGASQVMALLQVLCLFRVLPEGFRNAMMRGWMAQALGLPAEQDSAGRMTYALRRHRLIERIPRTQRYRVTDFGTPVALLFTKVHRRILRPGISQLFDGCPQAPNYPIATAIAQLDQALEDLLDEAKLARCKT